MNESLQKIEGIRTCPKCGAYYTTALCCEYCGLDLKTNPPSQPLEHRPARGFEMELRDSEELMPMRVKTTDDRITDVIRALGYGLYNQDFYLVGDSPNLSGESSYGFGRALFIITTSREIPFTISKPIKKPITETKKLWFGLKKVRRTFVSEIIKETVYRETEFIIGTLAYFQVGAFDYGNDRYNHEAFHLIRLLEINDAGMALAKAVAALPDVDCVRIMKWKCYCGEHHHHTCIYHSNLIKDVRANAYGSIGSPGVRSYGREILAH
jgi:hypothetical protein